MGLIRYLFSKLKSNITVRKTTIYDIDRMDGIEFEQYSASLLEKLGYNNVKVTQSSNDYGIDITCLKNGKKYAIQCKRYANKLGNSPVQEATAGKRYYNCDIGVVLTNNYFTENAINLAKANNILLWDRTELIKMLKKAKKKHSTSNSNIEQIENIIDENQFVTMSPYTNLPINYEIDGVDYDIESESDIAKFPVFEMQFEVQGKEYYVNNLLSDTAKGYEKHGMYNLANALYKRAEQMDKESKFLASVREPYVSDEALNDLIDANIEFGALMATSNKHCHYINNKAKEALIKKKAVTNSKGWNLFLFSKEQWDIWEHDINSIVSHIL